MATTYLHAVASLDGYIADEDDGVGSLHDWLFSGDQPIVDQDDDDVHGGAPFRTSAASAAYVRDVWSRQAVLVIGRHQFDLTDGWEGKPPASEHVVVVSHRPKPEGWHPEASYHFARGKPYFGNVVDGHLMLEDPEVVIQGERVLHFRYPVRR